MTLEEVKEKLKEIVEKLESSDEIVRRKKKLDCKC